MMIKFGGIGIINFAFVPKKFDRHCLYGLHKLVRKKKDCTVQTLNVIL